MRRAHRLGSRDRGSKIRRQRIIGGSRVSSIRFQLSEARWMHSMGRLEESGRLWG